ncbi:MAG: insulinase family protein, partial [Cytophagales bacterium]
ADKLPEAVEAMEELFEKIPKSDQNIKTAKEAIIKSIESERITKASVLTSYEMAKKIGVDYDLRRDVFNSIDKMDFSTIEEFQKKFVSKQPKAVLVLGDRNRLPFEYLTKKYGTVKELSLEDVFGY